MYRLGAYRFCKTNIFRAVSYYPGGRQVKVEGARGCIGHSRAGFAILTGAGESRYNPVGMVRAIEVEVYVGPVLGEPLGYVRMDSLDIIDPVEPSGYTSLVGNDGDWQAGLVERCNGLGRAVYELDALDRPDVARIYDYRAITVE
jgi:hypothetical protein